MNASNDMSNNNADCTDCTEYSHYESSVALSEESVRESTGNDSCEYEGYENAIYYYKCRKNFIECLSYEVSSRRNLEELKKESQRAFCKEYVENQAEEKYSYRCCNFLNTD